MTLLLYANHCCLRGCEILITLYRLVFLHPIYRYDTLGSASHRLPHVTDLIYIDLRIFSILSTGLKRANEGPISPQSAGGTKHLNCAVPSSANGFIGNDSLDSNLSSDRQTNSFA